MTVHLLFLTAQTDYIAVVKVFSENKNLLKKIRLLSVN